MVKIYASFILFIVNSISHKIGNCFDRLKFLLKFLIIGLQPTMFTTDVTHNATGFPFINWDSPGIPPSNGQNEVRTIGAVPKR